jgi:hypothetical protein
MAIPTPAANHSDDRVARMQLALLPRFAALVIELDDEEIARNLG